MRESKMTNGTVWKKIFFFTIPLLLGNIFQLLYSTVDSIVVGQYVGSTALAAVSASGPLVNLTVGFFVGVSVGAGVIVGRHYGAGRKEELSVTVHTFITFSVLFGVVLVIIGSLFSSQILMWMKTPTDVLPQATEYLRIYFLGVVFLTLYNAVTGILRAVGDSKTPLYFLIISSCLNIVLDVYFVTSLDMGISGVAWATLLSQGVSCILVLVILLKSKESYKLRIKKIGIDIATLKQIIRIGIPSGFQNMIVSFSNVLVQSYVNSFGSTAIAGFGAALKLNGYISLPINSFALSVTTFTAQNIGANKMERVKDGIQSTLIMGILSVVLLGIPIWIAADFFVGFFTQDPAVIAVGATAMRTMIPFFIPLGVHLIYSGVLRAQAKTIIPMLVSIISMVVVRQLYLWMIMPIFNRINVVSWGYSLTWSLAAILTTTYFYLIKGKEEVYNPTEWSKHAETQEI